MKTFFEIANGKSYSQLTNQEKDMIQDRQTELVIEWQDMKDDDSRWQIEEELMASADGLIKGLAQMNADKSFSVDKEDFEGLISLVFAETLMEFDRTLNKPFQPIFIIRVRYAILEMYRAKGYDLHDTTDRLDRIVGRVSGTTMLSDVTVGPSQEIENATTALQVEEILTELFGKNSTKKKIVNLMLEGYKRSEIVHLIREDGKSSDSVAKMVNRTVKQFKEHYVNLHQANLV